MLLLTDNSSNNNIIHRRRITANISSHQQTGDSSHSLWRLATTRDTVTRPSIIRTRPLHPTSGPRLQSTAKTSLR